MPEDIIRIGNVVSTHQDTVGLIRAESERVREYINGLSQDVLELPTPCERWTVGDLIAHLVWFAETYGGMMERGLRGDLSPPEGFPDSGSLRRGESAELYAMVAINRRKDLGPELLPALNQQYDWLDAMLSGIGPEDWEKPCYHTSRLRPVESFLPTIVQELAVHEWDIRTSLEPAPPLSAESLPVLMGKLPLGKAATNNRPWRVPFPVIYDRTSLDSALSGGNLTAVGDLEQVADIERWLSAH
jgi:uncharacterized protein (TIGR03083 family)